MCHVDPFLSYGILWCTRGWDRLFRFCTSLACRELLLSRVESGAMSATLIVVALYKAVLNLPGALQTEMYSFGAVYLRAEILLPGDVHRIGFPMHHMPCERSLTMPSGPKAALDYWSMLQLAAKLGFDFHDDSGCLPF